MGALKLFRRARSKLRKDSSRVPEPSPQSTISDATVHSLTPQPTVLYTPVNSLTPESSLLKLPGEIRNRIYRLVLVRKRDIEVSSVPSPFQPPLLRTCRTIRQETVGIYYLENTFNIDCRDWDYSFWKRFHHDIREIKRSHKLAGKVTITWANSGSLTHRANLLKFLKACHEDTAMAGLRYNKNANTRKHAVTGAFRITKHLDGQAWSMVESVLEVYLDEVAKHGGWQWQ